MLTIPTKAELDDLYENNPETINNRIIIERMKQDLKARGLPHKERDDREKLKLKLYWLRNHWIPRRLLIRYYGYYPTYLAEGKYKN